MSDYTHDQIALMAKLVPEVDCDEEGYFVPDPEESGRPQTYREWQHWCEGHPMPLPVREALVAVVDAALGYVMSEPMTCTWREDWEGNWHTGCGHTFVMIDGKPEDNGMVFCCYCGGLLEQQSFDSEGEESE